MANIVTVYMTEHQGAREAQKAAKKIHGGKRARVLSEVTNDVDRRNKRRAFRVRIDR